MVINGNCCYVRVHVVYWCEYCLLPSMNNYSLVLCYLSATEPSMRVVFKLPQRVEPMIIPKSSYQQLPLELKVSIPLPLLRRATETVAATEDSPRGEHSERRHHHKYKKHKKHKEKRHSQNVVHSESSLVAQPLKHVEQQSAIAQTSIRIPRLPPVTVQVPRLPAVNVQVPRLIPAGEHVHHEQLSGHKHHSTHKHKHHKRPHLSHFATEGERYPPEVSSGALSVPPPSLHSGALEMLPRLPPEASVSHEGSHKHHKKKKKKKHKHHHALPPMIPTTSISPPPIDTVTLGDQMRATSEDIAPSPKRVRFDETYVQSPTEKRAHHSTPHRPTVEEPVRQPPKNHPTRAQKTNITSSHKHESSSISPSSTLDRDHGAALPPVTQLAPPPSHFTTTTQRTPQGMQERLGGCMYNLWSMVSAIVLQ